MATIINPEDPESLWLCSRTRVVEEYYFDNEAEARQYAADHPCFTVEAPVDGR